MPHFALPKGKILLITTDYPPDVGGVAWYYFNLVKNLNSSDPPRGGKVDVLKLGNGALTWKWPFIVFLVIFHTLTRRRLYGQGTALPVLHYWWAGQVLPVGTVLWLLSYLWQKPYIVSTHGMDVLMPLRSYRKRWLAGKILERAALITANSEWTKQQVLKNYKLQITNNKFIVIYPEPKPRRDVALPEVHALRHTLGIPEDAKILLSVGRLVRRKGIDRVIAALPEAWREMKNVHYVVVGEGEERERLEEMVGVRGHSPVHFVGTVSDEELAVYYTRADAFILLPRDTDGDVEGFCIVYREADQYGLPIVACKSGGTGEALAGCAQVRVVDDPDNTSEVAEKICLAFR